MLEENNEHIKPKRKKKKRWWLKIIYFLVALFVLSDLFLFFFATPVLKSFVQDKVSEKTNGLFSIDFENISFEISTRRLAIKDLSLISDTSVYNELLVKKKVDAALYNVNCKSIELWGIGLYSLISKNTLKASELKLDEPVIELKKVPEKEKDKNESRDFVHQDLFPAISDYIDEINLKRIKLENGIFNLNLSKTDDEKNTHFGYVSVQLFDFLLNEEQHKKRKKLFHSNDLQINVTDYKVNLNDKTHYIFADTIYISTKESKLLVKNLGLVPINQSNRFLNSISGNYFKAKAPLIEFQNFNIYDLYFENDISIGNISINSPSINFVNKLKRKVKKNSYGKSMEIDLSKLIEGKLNSVKVEKFQIDSGNLNFFYSNWNRNPSYSTKNFSIALNNFELNEKSQFNRNKIFYSDSVNFSANKFKASLPDNIHQVHINSFELSTKKRTLKARGISMVPGRKNAQNNLFKINIPGLRLAGIDFLRLYHQRLLNISHLTISKSKIEIDAIKKEKDINDTIPRKSPIESVVTNFVKQIYIRNFKLGKSKFDINLLEIDSTSLSYSGEVIFGLERLLIDKETINNPKSNIFFSDNFSLKLFDYNQDLRDHTHSMQASSIEVSSIDSLLEITNFKIKPKTQFDGIRSYRNNKSYNIKLIQAYIKGIDINKAYNDSCLYAKSISLLRPNLSILNHTQQKTDSIKINGKNRKKKRSPENKKGTIRNLLAIYFNDININAFNIENANIRMDDIDSLGMKDLTMKASLSAKFNNFNLLPKTDSSTNQSSYADNISFRVRNYFGKLISKKYQLKLKEARFNSRDSSFRATIVRLFPTKSLEKSLDVPSLFSLYTPTLVCEGVIIEDFMNEDVLNLGKLTIESPSLALTQRKKQDKTNSIIEQKDSIKKTLNLARIKFDEINIKNGVFGILHDNFNFENLISNTRIDLKIKNLDIDTNSLSDPKNILANLDMTVKLTDTHYQLPDSLHFIDLSELELSTSKKSIFAKHFEYNTISNKPKRKPVFVQTFKTPGFHLTGFEFDKLISEKQFISDSLIIDYPQIALYNRKDIVPPKKVKLSEINLYEKLKGKLNLLSINKIKADNSKINFTEQNNFTITRSQYDRIFAEVTGLHIDSLNQKSGDLLNCKDIAFKIEDYEYKFKKKPYKLYVKELGFSTLNKSIYANSLHLYPAIGRLKYAEQEKKEISLNYLKTKKIKANNVDFIRLVDEREFLASSVRIDKAQFHNYKNKQNPMDSVKRAPLPLDFIWDAKKLIKVDTVGLKDSYIGHEILGINAKEDGFIDFTRLNAEILNLTNDSNAIKNKEMTTAKASAYFMDKSLLTSSFLFPIASDYGEYIYGGRLDTLEMRMVNPILENLLFVSIQDGTINSIDFNIVANDDYSTGNLIMRYDDLKLGLLSKKKSDSLVVEKRGLFSMVANSIVRDKNPKRKALGPKKGRIYFERDVYRPIFNYWTFSVLSGMKSTLGFKSKELKERLKIEKDSTKSNKKFTRKNTRVTKKTKKQLDKQIQQELKDELKARKKQERQEKKENRKKKKTVIADSFIKPENEDFSEN